MASIFSKASVLIRGDIHDLLDKAIDMNSTSALRQYVRDLEGALDQLRNEAAVAAGQVRTTERELAVLTANIEAGKTNIKKLQENNHTDMARTKAVDVVNQQKALVSKNEVFASEKDTSAKLDLAVASIESKHNEMLNRVHELETMDQSSKAKEHAASALTNAGKLVAGGTDISVDGIEAKIRGRSDIADEKLNRAMGTTTTQEDPDTTASVDDLLKSLK